MNMNKSQEKVPLEEALEKTGYGAYSYTCVTLAGVAVISYACVCYNTSFVVPASACEFGTNLAQQGVMVAGPFLAEVFGSVIWGYLGDSFGRRKMLLTALTGASMVNALVSLSVHWVMMLVLQSFSTFLIGGMFIWLPKISNQYVQLLQTGKESDLTLCSIIETSFHGVRNPSAQSNGCSLNVTALLMVLIVCAMQFLSNGILSLVVNRFGRRNSVMMLVTICGVSGALVNLVPNAVAAGLLFAGFLVGMIVVGPYTAMAVALFPTHLRTLAVAVTTSIGRLCGFFTIQIVNYTLVHSCRLGFFIFSAVFASSAFVLNLLPDDRHLNKPRIENKPEFEEVPLNPLEKPPRVQIQRTDMRC